MENQNDVSSSQSALPNMNVKFSIRDFSKFAYYIFHISNVAALLSAILLVLTYGTGSPFQTIRYLFASLATIVHASLIIIYLGDISLINKKDENASLSVESSNKSILNKLILCTDVHDICILFLFSYARITPILYVFSYIIFFSLNFINYTMNDVFPALGLICSPQNSLENGNSSAELSEEKKNDLSLALDPIKKISNSMAIKICPVIFQMIIVIQIFVITLFDISVFNLMLCIIYITWEVMFDYATNAIYHNVWSKIGSKINEIAESNIETYGNILSMILKGFSKIGYYANQLYK